MANYSGETLPRGRGARESRLSARRARFLAHPGSHCGIGLRRLGQLRAHGFDRWPSMGSAQHRAFGGDPTNVTIIGQSAGSMAVACCKRARERAACSTGRRHERQPVRRAGRMPSARRSESAGWPCSTRSSARSIEACAISAATRSWPRPSRATDRPRRPLCDRCATGFESGPAQRRADHARFHARRVVSLAGAGVYVAELEEAVRRTFPRTAAAILARTRRRCGERGSRRGRYRPRHVGRRADGQLGPRTSAVQPFAGVCLLLHAAATVCARASRLSITTPRPPARITRLRLHTF